MVKAVAIARSFPTEDAQKVRLSLLNIFPLAEVTEVEEGLEAVTDDLSRFKELLRNHKILDSARALMLRGLADDTIVFHLNKQAAFVGKVSFAEGSPPLGCIVVTISGEDLEALIDDVAPRTVNGVIP